MLLCVAKKCPLQFHIDDLAASDLSKIQQEMKLAVLVLLDLYGSLLETLWTIFVLFLRNLFYPSPGLEVLHPQLGMSARVKKYVLAWRPSWGQQVGIKCPAVPEVTQQVYPHILLEQNN